MFSDLVVRKYGGKCLASVASLKEVASSLARLHHEGQRLIVVVSAMGQTTDELIGLAHQVSPKPNRREMDMLLSTGERMSMALLSMALNELGCPAVSLTGSQAGVITDDSHSNAHILDVRPIRVEELLKNRKIVVLAGFQGVSGQSKEITTLGRGGSDTTAVAMAAHFKARACEILKDVNGIGSGDPKKVDKVHYYSELSFAQAREMCFWGAKVLHYRAVELAERHQVPLFVGPASHGTGGTRIQKEISMYEQLSILSVNSHAQVEHIKIPCASTSEAYFILETLIREEQLAFPQILASVFDRDHCRMMITSDSTNLRALLESGESRGRLKNLNWTVSSVTITGFGPLNPEASVQWLKALSESHIPTEKSLNNSMSCTLFIKPEHRDRALKITHDLFLS